MPLQYTCIKTKNYINSKITHSYTRNKRTKIIKLIK